MEEEEQRSREGTWQQWDSVRKREETGGLRDTEAAGIGRQRPASPGVEEGRLAGRGTGVGLSLTYVLIIALRAAFRSRSANLSTR